MLTNIKKVHLEKKKIGKTVWTDLTRFSYHLQGFLLWLDWILDRRPQKCQPEPIPCTRSIASAHQGSNGWYSQLWQWPHYRTDPLQRRIPEKKNLWSKFRTSIFWTTKFCSGLYFFLPYSTQFFHWIFQHSGASRWPKLL